MRRGSSGTGGTAGGGRTAEKEKEKEEAVWVVLDMLDERGEHLFCSLLVDRCVRACADAYVGLGYKSVCLLPACAHAKIISILLLFLPLSSYSFSRATLFD